MQTPLIPSSRLRATLRFLGDLGCVALAIGSLLVWSARWFWLGEVATSFTWYLGWAGLCGAFALGLIRRLRLAIVVALFGSFHLWPEVSLWLPDSRNDATNGNGQELTIASCNLYWDNRKLALLEKWIEEHNPDIIAFQELSLESKSVLESLSESYPTLVLSPNKQWNQKTWGIGFLSRVPIKNTRWIPPIRVQSRPSLEVTVTLGGKDLVLRNAHPARPGRGARNSKRDAVLDSLASEDWRGMSILLGDLNVTSTSPAFTKLLKTSNLRDSRLGFGRQPTFTATQLGGLFSVAIDHILVSGSLQVIDRRIVKIPGSDHRGVVARIKTSGP
ncbi:MAG: endonuclease/exonuclease/phosphatase (EEP) superfamily protein YafD [Planctomycetota bacterium]|jgi:endonuclease/exonuclease/phosphatase (EEP) superfamily protein YafD